MMKVENSVMAAYIKDFGNLELERYVVVTEDKYLLKMFRVY